jgi:hypothetical protein
MLESGVESATEMPPEPNGSTAANVAGSPSNLWRSRPLYMPIAWLQVWREQGFFCDL